MTYDNVTKALANEGFFTHHREDTDTLVCSSAEWPNVPQQAHSFWVARRHDGWYLGTWAPHVYRFRDASKVPTFCVTWLREHPKQAQWDVDESIRTEFQLSEIDPDDLPTA
jgi:hypothetical protein